MALSVHVRRTRLESRAAPARPLGAVGGPSPGVRADHTLLTLAPCAFFAATRNARRVAFGRPMRVVEVVFAASVAPIFASSAQDSSQVRYCTSNESSADELSFQVRLISTVAPSSAAAPVSSDGGAGGR